jgi:tRNA dimethylallyltransferase
MSDRMSERLIAVVGATATGKTALAVALAQSLGGEIINADSRQLYRGMDIGTAKPTLVEQAAAAHHLIDVVDPAAQFTLANFLDLATAAITDIQRRGRVPIIAGGTGQYVWALLEGWRVPRVPPDAALRAELDRRLDSDGVDALARDLLAIDPGARDAIDLRNPRRVIRAIEVTRATGRPFSSWRDKHPPPPATIVGLRMDRTALYRRIDSRVDAMVVAGLADEVRSLLAAGYSCDLPSMSGIGYRQICAHLRAECTLDEAVARIKLDTHRLARMQNTWFRADDTRIHWIDVSPDEAPGTALASVLAVISDASREV